MSNLEPKTPETIAKLEWLRLNGLTYWKHILVAVLILSIPLFYKFITKASVNELKPKLTQEAKETPPKPDVAAPTVKFTDGSVRTVEMTVTTQLDPEKLLQAYSLFGSQEKSIDHLQQSIKGAAIAVLEKTTEDYVRANRDEISKEIIERTAEAQNRTGYTIIELNIEEIF